MKPTTDDPTATRPVRDAPAFDFYPERWLVGVAGMSDAEQLAYLRLLCHQWLLQGLPADVPALKRLSGGKGVTPAVLEKLPLMPDGKRRNARLETIRMEQRVRIAKKSEQRRAAAHKRWHSAPDAAPAEGMRAQRGSLCETDAADMRPHCGSTCEMDAAAMPTTDHPPPTSGVPEDANNAGARVAVGDEAAATGAALPAGTVQTGQECPGYGAGRVRTGQECPGYEAGALRAAAAAPPNAAESTPSLETVLSWAATLGCPADKAQIWWHEHEARPLSVFGRWTDRDGNAVQRPQHALAAWWRKWQANDHQRNTRSQSTTNHHANSRSTPVRSDTANAPGRYA
jgi:hypothetical protein